MSIKVPNKEVKEVRSRLKSSYYIKLKSHSSVHCPHFGYPVDVSIMSDGLMRDLLEAIIAMFSGTWGIFLRVSKGSLLGTQTLERPSYASISAKLFITLVLTLCILCPRCYVCYSREHSVYNEELIHLNLKPNRHRGSGFVPSFLKHCVNTCVRLSCDAYMQAGWLTTTQFKPHAVPMGMNHVYWKK